MVIFHSYVNVYQRVYIFPQTKKETGAAARAGAVTIASWRMSFRVTWSSSSNSSARWSCQKGQGWEHRSSIETNHGHNMLDIQWYTMIYMEILIPCSLCWIYIYNIPLFSRKPRFSKALNISHWFWRPNGHIFFFRWIQMASKRSKSTIDTLW
jgi:hypothetical protein